MRISRLLAGSIVALTFAASPIPGLPPVPNPVSDRQKRMDVERKRIAKLPVDASRPSRQTKRAFDRLMAKRRRGALLKKAGNKRSFVSADWRSFLTA